MFVTHSPFLPCLTFAGKANAHPMYPLTRLCFKSKLLALTTNISLGWKYLTETKGLPYYGTKLNTAVKVFIEQPPECEQGKML